MLTSGQGVTKKLYNRMDLIFYLIQAVKALVFLISIYYCSAKISRLNLKKDMSAQELAEFNRTRQKYILYIMLIYTLAVIIEI
jgi:hypothetical protein